MDKRALAHHFRECLSSLIAADEQSTSAFLRDTGIDRSALSQFMDPSNVRLPRAETLRKIAAARGVSVDWLLGLENAPEGQRSVEPSFQLENATDDGHSPLEAWRAEVAEGKLRYVPSLLPDMLNLELQEAEAVGEGEIRGSISENMLAGKMPEDIDIEICMPVQTLNDLAQQTGHWKAASPILCRRQLEHMAAVCEATYPTLRLHLFDGSETYSSSFTVFGKKRVAIFLGDAYLVLSRDEEIRYFRQSFDRLIRKALVNPADTAAFLADMARSIVI